MCWRIAIRRVWRIPWRTHNNMLAHIAGVMNPEYWFAKRCIKFVNMAINSSKATVKTISGMGMYDNHSIIAGNIRFLNRRYDMEIDNVVAQWQDECETNNHVIRTCDQVLELVNMRDKCVGGILSRSECNDVIYYLCTQYNLTSCKFYISHFKAFHSLLNV